jgi:hypothetical protein
MTVLSGDRAAQSVLRARAVARLRQIFELARSLATSSWSVTASLPGRWVLQRVAGLRARRR